MDSEDSVASKAISKGSIVSKSKRPVLLLPSSEEVTLSRRRRLLPLTHFCPGCGVGWMDPDVAIPGFPQPDINVRSSDDDELFKSCQQCRTENRPLSCVDFPPWQKGDGNQVALTRHLRSLVNSRGRDDANANAIVSICSLILCSNKLAQCTLDEMTRSAESNRAGVGEDMNDEMAEEVWALLKSACPSPNNGILARGPVFFVQIVRCILRSNIYMVSAPHPLSVYAEKVLPNLSEGEIDRALSIFRPCVDWIFRSDGKGHIDASAKDVVIEFGDGIPDERLLSYRCVARLAQVVGAPENAEMEDSEVLSDLSLRDELLRRYHVITTAFAALPHSCIPNCAVVGTISSKSEVFVKDAMGAIHVELLALSDIAPGDQLTVSRINGGSGLDLPVAERSRMLKEIMGADYVCDCFRCRFERAEDLVCGAATITQLKSLGDLAMQQGRYEEASRYYSAILKRNPAHGDALHARAASYLERGSYLQAQHHWREAYRANPHHAGIKLHVRKQDAYKYPTGSIEERSMVLRSGSSRKSYMTIVSNKCFLTMQNHPLLTPHECRRVIKWAEDAAKGREGGWTTSRHYAVPTTDLPVHELPKMLYWFNDLLAKRLRPLMASQFGYDAVGPGGAGLHVHDAFVVRYDAEGQRHLPIHRDESTHSFTIALNGIEEYAGGGTYIVSLGRSFRPRLGGVMTFRGDEILHGGDPVVKGVRYVIVGFCYIDFKSNIESKEKRPRLDGMFHSANSPPAATKEESAGAATRGFSFGFQI